jgi:23S rRNA pseudouridine1911/1915/1917 synthase
VTRIQTPDARRRPEPQPVPLVILYEDEHIIVLDKPAGLVIHPTYRNTTGTLLNGLLWHVRARGDTRPGILTRLDKGTSGLVLAGLTAGAHARMQKDMAAGHVRKDYLAVVHGTPDPASGDIDLALARDPEDRRRVVVAGDGARSRTAYAVLAQGREPGTCVLRCSPITGRTHQIRVHLAARGWPILGDAVYGRASSGIARQALHAWRLTLPHPLTRHDLSFEAPVPDDLAAILPQNLTL